MPKSKRDRKVSMTNVNKQPGLESKRKLIEKVQSLVDQYARIFAFSIDNQRTNKLQKLRVKWNHSRFLFGKNNVMKVALGKTKESEYRDNLSDLSARLWGQVGLLFTNKTKDEVLTFFKHFSEEEYAQTGCIAKQKIVIEKGPLEEFTFSLEPHLRSLGMPTVLNKGVIELNGDHRVCKKGERLTPQQARILKVFGHKSVTFRVSIKCMWSNDGTFEEFVDDHEVELLSETLILKPQKELYSYEFLDSDEDENKEEEAGGGTSEEDDDDDDDDE